MTLVRRALFLFLVGAGSVMGQEPQAEAPARGDARQAPSWGGSDMTLLNFTWAHFRPISSDIDWTILENGMYATSGTRTFVTSPQLPSGTLLTYLELDYCDSDVNSRVTLGLLDCPWHGEDEDCSFVGQIDSDDGAPNCSFISLDLTPANHTVNNYSRRLYLLSQTQSGTSSTRLVGAYLGYKLQVSPAPASATFTDVPTGHPYFRFVEALVESGITAGCGSGNYCPNAPITRGEMAVFLAAALGLHFSP
jgi:hypothetical protein